MFEKNLTDLVRGIRNNKSNEAKYIANCLDEIKQELRQENATVKANAVAKLTYLQMLGYDISWAAFNIIEVMSSSKFTFKRIGYMAASQSFHEDLDILMLTTNMIRKDLCSMNMYDAGVSLSGFACFVTTDLARDLANDVMSLLVSTKPYIRKRAVLLMYKIFLKFPEALRPAFPRLKEKLEDGEPGVQSAAVNVICELARKNPKNYLSLAPLFFKLMTSSTNNWMLIKIIKLFGALCPLEPRLGKKLLEPLTNLIHSTSAMSLLYECINTVVSGLPQHTASIQLCVTKLRILIEDSDQNLKYLGLLAMSKILTVNPKAVQVHKDIVLHCLDDKDESIRLRALDLIVGMVSKKTIMDIIKKLMAHIDKAESHSYCDELLSKIVEICSLNDYHYVTNFEWYIDVLIQLTRVEGTRHGKLLASQMMDVTIRVKAIRPYAVQCLSLLLDTSDLISGQMEKNRVCEVLYAAAWISGEFSEHLPDIHTTLEAMLQTKVTSLPGHIQAVYVQNIAKLYAKILASEEEEEEDGERTSVSEMLVERLPVFVQSADLEVQERASCVLQLIKYVLKLQGKGVHCTEELDLDKWINEPPSDSSEEEEEMETIFDTPNEHKSLTQKHVSDDEEELKKKREQRKQDNLSNPHYLKMSSREERKAKRKDVMVDDIPVANLDLPVSLKVSGGVALDKKYSSKKMKKRKGKKGRKGSRADEEELDLGISYEVLPTGAGELPEGAEESDHDERGKDEPGATAADPHKLLNVDLSKPLEAHETLPVRQHRIVTESQPNDDDDEEITPKKHSKDKKHRHRKDSEGKKSKHKHKKEKDDKEKKSKHKHHHHHHKDEVAEPVEDNLMFNGEVEHIESPPGDDLKEESEQTTPTKMITDVEDFKPSADEPSNPQDDMDFWLSTTPQEKSSPKPAEAPTAPSPDSEAAEKPVKEETHAKPSEKTESKESKRKHRKDKSDKKEKHEKERKKEKRKRRTSEKSDAAETPAAEPEKPDEPSIMELKEEKKQPIITTYKVLSENSSLRLMYETRVTSQHRSQVVVSIIFSNLTDRHIKSLEFNVLDSLNTKLIRPIGSMSHDSVPVPFHLLPGSLNEGQFAFTVESIVMAQKLRGTLTYVIKDDEGSPSEKMDFSVFLPCSSFLISTPLSSTDFANLLGSGTLANKSSVKVTTPETTEFSSIIHKICVLLHFAVVEQVDNSASLYASSIQGHHLCALVKQLPDHSVSVDGKSTDSSLVSSVLEEVKLLLQTPP
ncbi:AP-3 complex subunit delta-1 [Desmophyllum pertusum]|uniref:AP-3 complex subunit delta n=1 Tax=Desmophyllum pertusum TaxID=174260 RepID=A0A9W9ZRU6_9CNID|nr:AP-3 complex subunit delta-1 [Desmophyllum pertusum]